MRYHAERGAGHLSLHQVDTRVRHRFLTIRARCPPRNHHHQAKPPLSTAPIPRLVQPIPQPSARPPVKHPRSPNPRLLQGACGSIPWVSPSRSIRRVGAAGRGVGHPLGFHERSIPNPMTSSHATSVPVQYGASGGPHEALQRVTHQVKPPYTCGVVSLSESGPCCAVRKSTSRS